MLEGHAIVHNSWVFIKSAWSSWFWDLSIGSTVISGINSVGAINTDLTHIALIFWEHKGQGVEKEAMDEPPHPAQKHHIVGQVFSFYEFFYITAPTLGVLMVVWLS